MRVPYIERGYRVFPRVITRGVVPLSQTWLDNRYLVKPGLPGGQTAYGGTNSGDNLVFKSNTKQDGRILLEEGQASYPLYPDMLILNLSQKKIYSGDFSENKTLVFSRFEGQFNVQGKTLSKQAFACNYVISTHSNDSSDYVHLVSQRGNAEHFGTGTITRMIAMNPRSCLRGTGAITDMIALRTTLSSNCSASGGSITNAYHIYLRNFLSYGSVTVKPATQYGVYIENLTNATNNYGLYSLHEGSHYIKGTLGLGTSAQTSKLDIQGANGYSQLRLRESYTPTSTSDTNGNVGDIAWDDNYIYVKTSSGWKRAALSTF